MLIIILEILFICFFDFIIFLIIYPSPIITIILPISWLIWNCDSIYFSLVFCLLISLSHIFKIYIIVLIFNCNFYCWFFFIFHILLISIFDLLYSLIGVIINLVLTCTPLPYYLLVNLVLNICFLITFFLFFFFVFHIFLFNVRNNNYFNYN